MIYWPLLRLPWQNRVEPDIEQTAFTPNRSFMLFVTSLVQLKDLDYRFVILHKYYMYI